MESALDARLPAVVLSSYPFQPVVLLTSCALCNLQALLWLG